MHFLPGWPSSSRIGVMGWMSKRSPEDFSLFLAEAIFCCSKIVAAERGTTFLKNVLSNIRMDRFTGGRNMSRISGEFIFILPGTFQADIALLAKVAICYQDEYSCPEL